MSSFELFKFQQATSFACILLLQKHPSNALPSCQNMAGHNSKFEASKYMTRMTKCDQIFFGKKLFHFQFDFLVWFTSFVLIWSWQGLLPVLQPATRGQVRLFWLLFWRDVMLFIWIQSLITTNDQGYENKIQVINEMISLYMSMHVMLSIPKLSPTSTCSTIQNKSPSWRVKLQLQLDLPFPDIPIWDVQLIDASISC